MARIHPLAWVIIGSLVAATSWYITYARKAGNFLLFLIIGIIMLTYGLILFLLTRGTKRIEATDKKILVHHSQQQQQQFQHYFKYCPYCGSRIPSNALFCSYCGRRVQ